MLKFLSAGANYFDHSPEFCLAAIRAYLGVGLMVRGALFVGNPDVLLLLIKESGGWAMPVILTHYVVLAHVIGGLMLALGFLTRLAAACQVPILIAAVFFVHWGDGLMSAGQSLEFSGLVLFMLTSFFVLGGGRISVDARLSETPLEVYFEHENVGNYGGDRLAAQMTTAERE
ncbi:MAG: DoxX family protein [Polyangiaceae bacterium]|nr:DoxX family protein [Polyangiaceae bacterium]